MTPRIRLGCCFEGSVAACAAELAWSVWQTRRLVAAAGGVVAAGFCESCDVGWVASGGPAEVEEEPACCATAQTAEATSANHKTNRNEASPKVLTHELLDFSRPMLDTSNAVVVFRGVSIACCVALATNPQLRSVSAHKRLLNKPGYAGARCGCTATLTGSEAYRIRMPTSPGSGNDRARAVPAPHPLPASA